MMRTLAGAAALFLIALSALADYPDRPIRVVTPFVPGGLGDIFIRMITEPLSRSLKQPIIVEAKTGADGQLAAAEVQRSAPDGYTLLAGETSSMSMVPAVHANAPYDPLRDFSPVSHLGSGVFFIVANASVPAKSLTELVAHARARPGELAIASSSASMLATHHFMRAAQIQMLHVPYRGEPLAMPDLLAGRVQIMIATPFLISEPTKEGRLRVLAAVMPERSQPFPDVPTLRELGYPEPPLISWVGLFGPAKLPPELAERLSREVAVALAFPQLRADLEKRGVIARSSSPQELRKLVSSQLDFWRAAVRDGLIPKD
jgi:tripartite-type tricarboxylate transporter receptor subunit TctC